MTYMHDYEPILILLTEMSTVSKRYKQVTIVGLLLVTPGHDGGRRKCGQPRLTIVAC